MKAVPAMRMQLATREAVPSRIPTDGDYARSTRSAPPSIRLALGYVEAEPAAFGGERCRRVSFSERGGRLRVEFAASPSSIDERWPDVEPEPEADLADCLRQMTVGPSSPYEALLGYGKLLFRRTGFPATEGKEAFVVAGLLVNASSLPERTMLTLSGRPDLLVETDRVPDDLLFLQGDSPTSTFRTSAWGFGAEPRAILSTMHPDLVEACARHRSLSSKVDPDAGDREEIRRLEANPAVRSVVLHRDEDYASFLEFVLRSGRGDAAVFGFDSYPTAPEAERAAAVYAELFSQWHAAREDRYLRAGP